MSLQRFCLTEGFLCFLFWSSPFGPIEFPLPGDVQGGQEREILSIRFSRLERLQVEVFNVNPENVHFPSDWLDSQEKRPDSYC